MGPDTDLSPQASHLSLLHCDTMLILLLIPLAAAVTPENIRIIQQQSAIVADSALSQSLSRCLLNHFCAVGVNEIDGEVSDRSIASALLETYNVVSTVLDSDSVNTDLPNMRKIQSAFELGQVSRKSDLCNQVFACDTRDFNLPLPSAARAQQIDCSHLPHGRPLLRRLRLPLRHRLRGEPDPDSCSRPD